MSKKVNSEFSDFTTMKFKEKERKRRKDLRLGVALCSISISGPIDRRSNTCHVPGKEAAHGQHGRHSP
jgi:hypothetical protein